MQPLVEFISGDFFRGWGWMEVLVFLGFVNNLKSLNDTELQVRKLLQVMAVVGSGSLLQCMMVSLVIATGL